MTRLLIRISLGIFITLVISVSITHFILWNYAINSNSNDVSSSFGELVKSLADRLPPDEVETAIAELENPKRTVRIISIDSLNIPPTVADVLRRDKTAWMFDRRNNDNHLIARGAFVFVPLGGQKRVIVIGPMYPLFPNFSVWLVAGLAVVVVIVIGGTVLTRPIVIRLRQLERIAKKISQGDFSARADGHKQDAIGSLARTFNFMAERIQALLESQRQIVQAVAHELRTPTSRVRFGMEMMRMAKNPDELDKRGFDIESDLEELDGLIEELLIFSRYDAGQAKITPVELDPMETILHQIARLKPLFPNVVIKYELSKSSQIVSLDQKSFDRVIANLLGNAARYAKAEVLVRCSYDATDLIIEVRDDGPGIPPDMREKVLEPFFRLDKSRNRSSGGAGLGLAIVRRIMDANHGSITIGETEKGGVSIVSRWPLENKTSS